MKKFLMTLAAVLCCAMTTTVFTACGDDDDKTPEEDNKAAAAVFKFNLKIGNDMLNALDLTVDYYDASGKLQSEAVTSGTWTKTVKASLPTTLGARLNIKLKGGVDPANISVMNEDVIYSYDIKVLTASGKELNEGKTDVVNKAYPVPGNKLADWVTKHANDIVNCIYTVDLNGKCAVGSW
jgi:hypothetical protein